MQMHDAWCVDPMMFCVCMQHRLWRLQCGVSAKQDSGWSVVRLENMVVEDYVHVFPSCPIIIYFFLANAHAHVSTKHV